jgi:hypothetical protein
VRKYIYILCLFAIFCTGTVPVLAQAAFSYDMLLNDLEMQLKKGSQRALRDVATLLDKPHYHNSAIVLLEKYSFFTKKEIDLQPITRADFMEFFFKNQEKIKFSEILQAFYITPVEQQPYNFTVKTASESNGIDPALMLRNLVEEFDETVKKGKNSKVLLGIIERIGKIGTPESFQWMRNTLASTPFQKTEIELYLALCEGLKDEPTMDNLSTILAVSEKGMIAPELLSPVLIELTNYAITPQQTKHLLDTLETYEALRAFGYEKCLPFKDNFYEKVDFYGKILSRKDTPWLQRNALRDLLLTEHPRLLFYIAAQMRLKPDETIKYENLLKKLTKTQFLFPNTEGGKNLSSLKEFSNQLENIEQQKQFIRFWGNHAEDFKWEETRRCFVNKAEIAERTENYEKLFRRLNSENDSVALGSFKQLAQGDPVIIAELVEKFRPILRTYNKQLPDIRFSYLEQLARLFAFCQKNGHPVALPRFLESLLKKLSETRNPQVRYTIENEIMEYTEVRDLTGIEFLGCLYSGNPEMAFSIGRILDRVYSRTWYQVAGEEAQLRLFLKKSFVFKKIGVAGVCSSYQNKVENLAPLFKQRLLRLARVEDDADIINQIQIIAGVSDNNSNNNQDATKMQSMLSIFLNEPMNFANNDLRLLPNPQSADYQKVIDKIQSENERVILRLMMDYLDLHPSIDAVPSLFGIIGDDRRLTTGGDETEVTRVSDRVVTLLENIYGYSFKTEDNRVAWRRLWYSDGKNYTTWDKQFFEEQTQFLTKGDTFRIENILAVSQSKHMTEPLKKLVIDALKKLEPFTDIRRFKCRIPLKVSTDLANFEEVKISHKDLDDFIKIFEVDKDSTMWRFINLKTTDYNIDELGTFYNSLFKINWFVTLIATEKISLYQKDLAIQILQKYLTESELISDFEEQSTLVHIAELQNIGRTLVEKLNATLTLDASDESKATIQEVILSRIKYSDIGTVAAFFEQLSRKPGYTPTAFLYKDFGIPFFNPEKEDITLLIENHKKLKQIDFYKFYLNRFGVEFMKDPENLDFIRMYNLLKYEIVSPFTGGGTQRDYFTYGIIKVLELHFNNRLGFHEKLNENQSFYTYSAAKRAMKWMQYLESKKLVSPDPSVPSSFNRLFAGN